MYKKLISKFHSFSLRHLLFLFFIFPIITEYFEEGRLPQKPREWTMIIVTTTIIGITMTIIYRQYLLLEKLSLLDHLTGIGNRRMFELDLKREIVRAKRKNTRIVLIFFDLDGFKEVNDTYGHNEGDKVLVQFASGLSAFVRKGLDFSYRLGGDEFAVLFTDINDTEITDIETKIDERLSSTIFKKLPHGVSASMGLVILEEDETPDGLLKRADETMYRMKQKKNKQNFR